MSLNGPPEVREDERNVCLVVCLVATTTARYSTTVVYCRALGHLTRPIPDPSGVAFVVASYSRMILHTVDPTGFTDLSSRFPVSQIWILVLR